MAYSDTVYKWSIPVYRVDPQKAGEELERIADQRGALTPWHVVDESRKQSAPLHSCFEWNDKTAAEKYRRRQAQDLIRNIVAVQVGTLEPPSPVRAFVSLRQEEAYVPVAKVLVSRDMRDQMLAAALRDLEIFRQRYAALESMHSLIKHIDGLIAPQNDGDQKSQQTCPTMGAEPPGTEGGVGSAGG